MECYNACIVFCSELKIEELGKIISDKILGGAKLDGLEKCIYEEVPAVYTKNGILGLEIVLAGYSGLNKENDEYYNFIIDDCIQRKINKENKLDNNDSYNLSKYLVELFKYEFKDSNIIKNIELCE